MKRLVACRDNCFSKKINLYYGIYGESGLNDMFSVAEPLTMSSRKEGEIYPPFLTIDETTSQEFMDSLWQCGLRPSEGSGSAGSLAATERHLKDMKEIAFHALKIQHQRGL